MATLSLRKEISSFSTAVIKVGSKILTNDENIPSTKRVSDLVKSISFLMQNKKRILLVSSGAIAHGMKVLNLKKRPSTIPQKQACASIGQIRLMNVYEKYFSQYGINVGQVLVTWDDLRDKKRYLNLRNTIYQLFAYNSIPIINENDSVGIDEIKFGENDTLAAQCALLIKADLLVNLTDINGLYDCNPVLNKNARQIPVVESITQAIHNCASENKNEISVGGMITKLKAAEIAVKGGITVLIGDGFNHSLLEVLDNPSYGTVFLASSKKMTSKERWIAFSGQPKGSIIIDKGAVSAIKEKGKSLLPAGIKKVTGDFKSGDMVKILSEAQTVIGHGLVNYSSKEIEKIAGCKTTSIAQILGQKTFDEIIHRNNLVVF
jgi:glutamate 5-kinase